MNTNLKDEPTYYLFVLSQLPQQTSLLTFPDNRVAFSEQSESEHVNGAEWGAEQVEFSRSMEGSEHGLFFSICAFQNYQVG